MPVKREWTSIFNFTTVIAHAGENILDDNYMSLPKKKNVLS